MFSKLVNNFKQISRVKILIFTLMVVMVSGWGILQVNSEKEPMVQKPQENQESCLSGEEVENNLVKGGYLQNLYAANWAAAQDGKIVSILETMLGKKEQYEKQGVGAAFPFNALWALAHIKDPEALAVLERYYAKSQDDIARLAIAGYRLRCEKGDDCGVFVQNSCSIYSEPSSLAIVVQKITRGQPVRVLKPRIENPQEAGGRGGVQLYDYIELIPTGTRGYIPRPGDDFSPFI